jgi:hypothetical protein
MDTGRGVGSNTCSSDLWEQMGRINEVFAWKVDTYLIIFLLRRWNMLHVCYGTDLIRYQLTALL